MTGKVLLTTQNIELIDKKEFAKAMLEKNIEIFVIYISFLSLILKMTIHLTKKVQIALIFAKKVTVSVKPSDFANLFFEMTTNVFLEQIRANKHVIKREKGK